MPVFRRCKSCIHVRGVMDHRQIDKERSDGSTQRTTFYDSWLVCAAPEDLGFDNNGRPSHVGEVVNPDFSCLIWSSRYKRN